ncbi:N-acetylmuramoyl-L-alanine amidase [Clostridium estertheticum]|uniref:N-acetylmuramoyl-L-alanine amidase n=1 Tax=Clostridium estertheticum TaxID=238834 RepID=UPI00209B596B|nr:N-acetylmuramoyl-L-alanine amidase [Clostridium estertheticum]
MSKIAVRGGHNFACPGASAIIDETTEDRKIKDVVIKYLKLAGEDTLDVTPSNCGENEDLNYGTNAANNAKADLFIPIHFNKAYDSYNGKIGSEVWLNPNNATSVAVGNRIVNKLEALGFKNRGLKDGINGEHLHDIKASNMPSILVEVCFVEATEDVSLYKKLGADVIGKSIAEGIVGHTIGNAIVSTPIKFRKLIKIIKQTPLIDAGGANIRTFKVGDEVTAVDEDKNWWILPAGSISKVNCQEVIKTSTTKPITAANTSKTAQYGVVTASALFVRSGHTLTSTKLGTLDKGTKVRIDNKVDNFYSIYYGICGGFVSADYITLL